MDLDVQVPDLAERSEALAQRIGDGVAIVVVAAAIHTAVVAAAAKEFGGQVISRRFNDIYEIATDVVFIVLFIP